LHDWQESSRAASDRCAGLQGQQRTLKESASASATGNHQDDNGAGQAFKSSQN